MSSRTFTSPTWIDSACLYASECGWRLVPFHEVDVRGRCTCGDASCEQPGDHPRFEEWWDEATNEERSIESWEPLFPSSHVGVVCGPASNLVILEISEVGGQGTMSGTSSAGGRTIPRRTPHATDRGERSLYFFRHPGGHIPARIELAPGIRLVGDGIAVRIPDNHLGGSRARLRWRTSPLADPPPTLPQWIVDAADLRVGSAPALGEDEASSLPFQTAEDLFTHPARSGSDWLLEPWLWRGGLTLVTGAPLLAGKTTWCMHMASAFATGSRFLGHPVVPSPVVYLSDDEPAWFRRTLARTGPDRSRLGQLSVLHASSVRGLPWGELMRKTIDHCGRCGARVLVIDAIHTFAGLDNPAECATAGLHHTLELAMETGLSIVATLPTVETRVDVVAPALGALAASAQTLVVLRPTEEHRTRTRVAEIASRLNAPSHLVVELDAEGLRSVNWPSAPLFAPGRVDPLELLMEKSAAA